MLKYANPFRTSLLALTMAISLAGCSQKQESESTAEQSVTKSDSHSIDDGQASTQTNPFFSEYQTPFQIPPFDKIHNEHYMPAFEQGMTDHLAEIEAITSNPDAPTFENTLEALERSGKLLTKSLRVFFNLASSDTNPEIQKIQREISPVLAAHQDKINLNPDLFKRVEAIWKVRDTLELNEEQLKLLDDQYKDFVRNGALLDKTQKEKLTAINAELSTLATSFGQNLLAETNGFELILDKNQLNGLAEGTISAAANTAKQKMEKVESEEEKARYQDKYVFTPHRSSMYPFLTESTERDLRKQLYSAYINRGSNNNETDNNAIVAKIAKLRAQRAQILGYDSHADFQLEERMLKTPAEVYALLMKLWKPALARAKVEVADMQAMVKTEGHDFKLEAWDWWHYSEKVRKAKYDIDETSLKPYLTLDNVLQGAFQTSEKLWGLSFTELFDIDVYHPDVRVWEVKDKDGSHLGIFMGDFFTRSTKRGGAWMSNFKGQSNLDGRERPVVVNVLNISPPVGDAPALLTFENVITLFHEFGHGLHGLLTNTTYSSLSGISGPRDFTEFPAQIYEHWAKEPEVLKTFAKHYQTGEVIPDELIDKLLKASKFNQGFANTEYLAASLLDMDWHTIKADEDLKDTNRFEKASLERIGLIGEIAPRYRSTYFSHIFAGGYAAGYYGYIHSAVLDSDGFAAFKETGDIFNQELAQKYRTNVLEKGSTEEAMTLYKKFRGREPKIDALLKVRGLDNPSETTNQQVSR
ncbi:M3 family metallopeptidase [Marinibactrum halimedae]|uniref:Dipeptidyl carboxypeptidase II n=1 Tax=Marinibactrum halimedae TaxID=1444977 RepID=A0AA37T920_9GAMM|nr:M3 family metallopeptidase [Marinibactrum halimedae]MCD9460538.1 M3 family metallopeptidase [Marinibactrum halimedae]GLS27901.1 dipeptidyl carboxypeptidase II [Marinibactrum halimedae]